MEARSTTPPLVSMLIVGMLLAMIAGSTQAQPVSPRTAVDKDTSPSTTCTFSDVMPPPYNQSSNQYYALAIYELCSAPTPIVTGYSDGTFRPDNLVTRQEYAKITVLQSASIYVPSPNATPTANCNFSDVHVGDPLYQYVYAICLAGIITGYPPSQCTPNTQKCFKPNNTIMRAEMATILSAALGLPLDPNHAIVYPDVPSGFWAFKQIAALYDAYIYSNAGTNFTPTRLVTRGYASFYNNQATYLHPERNLSQAIAHKRANGNFYIHVEARKTTPFGNNTWLVNSHNRWTAGPVGLSNGTTFIESGPSYNVDDSGGPHSYFSASTGDYWVNRNVFLYSGDYNYYFSTASQSGTWVASTCDPRCISLGTAALGVTSLPYVGSNAETDPPAENLGNTTSRETLAQPECTGGPCANGEHWCYEPSRIINTAGAIISACSGSPDYYWDISWTR